MTNAWHEASAVEALQRLEVDRTQGLSEEEVARRASTHGPNELQEQGRKGPWRILASQFTATLVIVLLLAAVLSFFVGDLKNAIAILAIVVLNGLFGFAQEYRAEQAMASLKKMTAPIVRVRRAGTVTTAPSRALVPGDIVFLEAGNIVPGDCRLIEAANLRVQEAALTGESEPVEKDAALIAAATDAIGDRRNMAYLGTVVANGRGEAVVVATGMRTELGRIAALMQSAAHEPTPLQRQLDRLGKQLAAAALVIAGIVLLLGLLRGESLHMMFLAAVSLAVAAVPEGLPAVVTIALALGAQRMYARRALVRRLSAVEALGSVTVICADKTGTLTENRMTVRMLATAGHEMPLDALLSSDRLPAFGLLLAGGALCNDAVPNSHSDGSEEVLGDPTETALITAATRAGMSKAQLDQRFPRVEEVPFDSGRKRMSTVHRLGGTQTPEDSKWRNVLGLALLVDGSGSAVLTKGAADRLLDVSNAVWMADRAEPLDGESRRRMAETSDRWASDGMRVLGVAMRFVDSADAHDPAALEQNLTFLGLVGISDPPRHEARAAVERCRNAGIRPVMITGDHPLTAESIARDVTIGSDSRVVTGEELSRLEEADLDNLVEQTTVYARVAPEHKLRIVQALQRRGQTVAMTGDGVNDAPALRQADIGVAMGVTGTDVSKDAADIVLTDDNFATIVAAVEEGRVIYDNIRKFITFLVASNSAEIWVVLLGPILGMPFPLLPLQILWINLVTDGPAALALAVEPGERNLMTRPPHGRNEHLFSRPLMWHVVWVGGLMAALSLAAEFWYWRAADPKWQTMIFTTLTVSQMANVLASRSAVETLWKIGLFSNKPLLAAVCGTLLLQAAVIYVPVLQIVFNTVPLSIQDVAIVFGLSGTVFFAVELVKQARSRSPQLWR